jgi:hypothetical protein
MPTFGRIGRIAVAVGGALIMLTPVAAPPAAAAPQIPSTLGHPTRFIHPGVLENPLQLAYVRLQVRRGAQPWAAAYEQMRASPLASLDRMPTPRALVECGSFSNPNLGCTDERQDALAAYADALIWSITGDRAYAEKAISIMNAWSGVITGHTNSNAPLQTGWAGATWPRAAEIIRYTYRGWPSADVERFSTMLRDVYLPVVIKGHATNNGNWELTMMEAAVGISVFLDDRASYDTAIAKFRARVPAYLYLASDGPLPAAPPGSTITTPERIVAFWGGQSTFVDGLAQETCRDFVHTGYGLASIAHVAEITRNQLDNLYPELRTRLSKALEFHALYESGAPVPAWLCGGKLTLGLGPSTELAYNALHFRMREPLPVIGPIVVARRPANTNLLFIGWDTLTHANNPF